MRIIIGGDVLPQGIIEEEMKACNMSAILDEKIQRRIGEADHCIVNLECPLTDREDSKQEKFGASLKASPKVVRYLKDMEIDLVGLANNHILDYGEKGIEDTKQALTANGIAYIGIQGDENRFHSFQGRNETVAVYACTEIDFSTSRNGAIGFHPLHTAEEIREIRRKVDYLIVLYHAGIEFFRFPSPRLQDECRAMINSGANLVICQHSHCIGCVEKSDRGTIIYGQGHFLSHLVDNEYTRTGLLVSVDTQLAKGNEISYFPIVATKKGYIRQPLEDEEREIFYKLKERNSMIENNPEIIQSLFEAYCNQHVSEYILTLKGINVLRRLANKLTKGSYSRKIVYNKKQLTHIINNLQNPSHYECLLSALKAVKDDDNTNKENHE